MMCIMSKKVKISTEDFKVKNTRNNISPRRKLELTLQKLCIPVKDQIYDVLARRIISKLIH